MSASSVTASHFIVSNESYDVEVNRATIFEFYLHLTFRGHLIFNIYVELTSDGQIYSSKHTFVDIASIQPLQKGCGVRFSQEAMCMDLVICLALTLL
jgi:hypothetical protein